MKKLTPEQKEARKEERKVLKAATKEAARIEAERTQKPVQRIIFSIEWKRSQTWGSNPTLTAQIKFKDGTHAEATARASGCGYDKESTVIADIFNRYLVYKLYLPLHKVRGSEAIPYGIRNNNDYRRYSGGIGTECYTDIARAIGGEFRHIASGKTYDSYVYDDAEPEQ
jgi:hypothetical protein